MSIHRVKAALAASVVALAIAGVGADAASGQTLQRQLICDGAEPNALTENLPLVASGCGNGEYDPETESYAPYDPETDDSTGLGLGESTGLDLFGL